MVEKLNKIKNSKKGITLIALVVTIIVLLILASVSIAMLTGENGIIKKATTSKEKTSEAEVEENISLATLAAKDDEGNFSQDLLIEKLEKYGLKGEKIDDNVIVTTDKKTYKIDDEGKITSDHVHKYVATELKDCSDEIKTAYKFKGEVEGMAGYGNESVKYKAGIEIGDIVYVSKESNYGSSYYVTHIGYHEITSEAQNNNTYYLSTLLGESYKINVCSICGAYNKN